jgi:hypothetical protein
MCKLRRHCVLGSRMFFDRGAGIDIREIARGIMIVCVAIKWNEEARQNKNVSRVRQRNSRCHHTASCTLSGSGPTYILA